MKITRWHNDRVQFNTCYALASPKKLREWRRHEKVLCVFCNFIDFKFFRTVVQLIGVFFSMYTCRCGWFNNLCTNYLFMWAHAIWQWPKEYREVNSEDTRKAYVWLDYFRFRNFTTVVSFSLSSLHVFTQPQHTCGWIFYRVCNFTTVVCFSLSMRFISTQLLRTASLL